MKQITKLRQEINLLKEIKEPTEVTKPEESKFVDINKELEEEIINDNDNDNDNKLY